VREDNRRLPYQEKLVALLTATLMTVEARAAISG
jgi:hypothetical protein